MLVGDDQRLTQVITNLLSNAVKFTPELGSISLSSKFIEETEGLCKIQIEVRDTGIGISAEQQSRIFHSFEQAEAGTSRKFGGTGLGLAISKRIIDMMGGLIWVESENGKGSKFAFNVYLQQGAEKKPGKIEGNINQTEMLDNTNGDDTFPGYIILIAEDIEINREIIKALLESIDLTVECAEDGVQVCNMFEQAPDKYDMIFMDVQMPQRDGYSATRHIRAFEAEFQNNNEQEFPKENLESQIRDMEFPKEVIETQKECLEFPKETPKLLSGRPEGVPIIAMTANVFREDIEKCLEAGMNGHIGKPIDFDKIIAILKTYLVKR